MSFSSGSRRFIRRAARPLLAVGVLTAGMTMAVAGPANAGTTLGQSAAEKGRYFGAAVGTYKFNDRPT